MYLFCKQKHSVPKARTSIHHHFPPVTSIIMSGPSIVKQATTAATKNVLRRNPTSKGAQYWSRALPSIQVRSCVFTLSNVFGTIETYPLLHALLGYISESLIKSVMNWFFLFVRFVPIFFLFSHHNSSHPPTTTTTTTNE